MGDEEDEEDEDNPLKMSPPPRLPRLPPRPVPSRNTYAYETKRFAALPSLRLYSPSSRCCSCFSDPYLVSIAGYDIHFTKATVLRRSYIINGTAFLTTGTSRNRPPKRRKFFFFFCFFFSTSGKAAPPVVIPLFPFKAQGHPSIHPFIHATLRLNRAEEQTCFFTVFTRECNSTGKASTRKGARHEQGVPAKVRKLHEHERRHQRRPLLRRGILGEPQQEVGAFGDAAAVATGPHVTGVSHNLRLIGIVHVLRGRADMCATQPVPPRMNE